MPEHKPRNAYLLIAAADREAAEPADRLEASMDGAPAARVRHKA
jgi:hypothetical protein